MKNVKHISHLSTFFLLSLIGCSDAIIPTATKPTPDEAQVIRAMTAPASNPLGNCQPGYLGTPLTGVQAGVANPHIVGTWNPVDCWPIVSIHAALVPSTVNGEVRGEVLSWSTLTDNKNSVDSSPSDPHNNTWFYRWNYTNGNGQAMQNNTDFELFCSGQTLDNNGNLLMPGGHKGQYNDYGPKYQGIEQSHLYSRSGSFSRTSDMREKRWYPSTITLGDGRILVLGGSHDGHMQYPGGGFPEIWNPNTGTFDRLDNANYWRDSLIAAWVRPFGNIWTDEAYYPRIHLLPDGRVFHNGATGKMAFLNTAGEGSWSSTTYRSDVFSQRLNFTSVMYAPGQIMLAGGHTKQSNAATNTAMILSTSWNSSTIGQQQIPSMNHVRSYHNATLLPNGNVVVTGGVSGGGNVFANPDHRVRHPEIWNPNSNSWVVGTPSADTTTVNDSDGQYRIVRGYHSVALLLPDGRIWTAGGGACGACNYLHDQRNSQIYNPPYLYKNDGSGALADRPSISSAPQQMVYGQNYTINVVSSKPISSVVLMGLGSVTHSFDMNQRRVTLSITSNSQTGNTHSVSLTSPSNANVAPAGYYMLFALDSDGVPSVARFVQLRF